MFKISTSCYQVYLRTKVRSRINKQIFVDHIENVAITSAFSLMSSASSSAAFSA